MSKKDWIAVGIVLVIVAASYWISGGYDYKNTGTPAAPATTQQNSIAPAIVSKAEGFYIGSAYVSIVTYDGNGFSPATITIPKGSAVIFRNYSPKELRVASNPHPTHDGYPTKNGCVGSTFDSCSNIPPKVSWSFFFDYPGEWGYHNHLNPSQGGTVIVQ
ncbi:MAG TPA: hypothetical protein VMV71_02370 [Candidatus Paceibacterota bacterium]|nr:hypothetical protein [Candidatus Paceibacterota bacterium]